MSTSTVAFESTFSTEGRVIHYYRSRMTMDAVRALICTQLYHSMNAFNIVVDEIKSNISISV